jgi:hypothetical protein
MAPATSRHVDRIRTDDCEAIARMWSIRLGVVRGWGVLDIEERLIPGQDE